jgi:hypothetical protein
MAVTVQSVDEITGELADVYDAFIAPKKIWRNHNNKLYLALRSIAAGYKRLTTAVLALRNRFDPRYCTNEDLIGTMLMVGETVTPGKKSILKVMVFNDSASENITLEAGTYRYVTASGDIFSSVLAADALFAPGAVEVMLFASADIGSFPVSDIASIKLARQDGKTIDPNLSFSCLDNAGSLGRAEESLSSVRQRILNDDDRQDAIKELEQAIKSIASIYECNLIFNSGSTDYEYDGVTLAPYELLIIITGVPSEELADAVVKNTFYATHMVTPDMVVYHYNDLLAGGKHPVYYKFHDKEQFYLFVSYRYSSVYLQRLQIEAEINRVFAKYKSYLTHIDAVTEDMLYNDLAALKLPGFRVTKIYIQQMQDGDLVAVPSVDVSKTRLPELQTITYYAEDTNTGGAT